jgi:hypothetical protein
MTSHRFAAPNVLELPDPRVLRANALSRRTVRSPFDMPPDDWAIFPPVVHS